MKAEAEVDLFPGEYIVHTALYPMLAYHRAGSPAHPLLVFAPGGGHLARIAYGHPGSRERDFLVPWLARAGYEVLAVSYPADHPAIAAGSAAMTVAEWAQCMAEVTALVAARSSEARRSVVMIGWSMAGRLARAFAVAAHACGLDVRCFISLAATAPLLNLTSPRVGGEPVTTEQFWDATTRDHLWETELAAQDRLNGRVLIPREIYRRHYRCNNPISLRGEPRANAPFARSIAEAIEDLGTFEYEQYPLCAAVVPTSPRDARHALTDRATWNFLNSQKIYADLRARSGNQLAALDPVRWNEVRRRVIVMSRRLFREVEGGHFFFVGEKGARKTASHIDALIGEASDFTRWRDSLFAIGA